MRQSLYQGNNAEIATSMYSVGISYKNLGYARAALVYLWPSLKMRQSLYKGDHSEIATSLNAMGVVLHSLGNTRKSLDYLEQSLKIKQSLYKDDHHDVANSLYNVGAAYQNLGDTRKALGYYKLSMKMRHSLYKCDHADVANSLNVMGIAYKNLGDNRKALIYLTQALKMKQSLYEGNHPEVANLLQNVGVVYQDLEDTRKAIGYYKLSLKMRHSLYKHDHADIANSLNAMGLAHQNLGDNRKALIYLKQALKMKQSLYGCKHPEVANSLHNMGVVYHISEDIRKAFHYYELALNMRQLFYKYDHPDVVASFTAVCITGEKLVEIEKYTLYQERAKSMQKTLNWSEQEAEFKGQGTLSYASYSYLEYYNSAIDQILRLRLDGLKHNANTALLKSRYFGRAIGFTAEKLAYDVTVALSDSNIQIVLAPINLHNKHWLGLLFKRLETMVEVTYLDSEQRAMLPGLKEELEQGFAVNGYQSRFLGAKLTPQRYNNCGFELLENFVYYLTSTRATQEGAMYVHSLLVENSLLDPMEYGLKLEENRKIIMFLSNAESVGIMEVPLLAEQVRVGEEGLVSRVRSVNTRSRTAASFVVGIELFCKKLLYHQELRKFTGMIGEYEIELPSGLTTVDVLLDNSKFNKLVMNRIHPDKNPFGADVAHKDTLFAMDLRDKFAEDLKLEDSLVKINYVLYKSSIGFKALDVVVDSARLAYEPSMDQAKKLVLDSTHLCGLMIGANGYSLAISGAEAAYQLHEREYQKAFDVAASTLSAMALPVILAHANRPYLGFVYGVLVAASTAYNALENAYSFALELVEGSEALGAEFIAGQALGFVDNDATFAKAF